MGYGRNKDLCDVQIQTYGQTNLIDFYTNNTNVWNLGVSVMQDPNAYECSVQAKYLLFDDMNSSAPYKVEIAGGSKSTNSNDGLSSKYETSTEHSFELYPNPTENKLTIKQLDEQSSAIVRIYDLNGSIVLEENLTDVIQQFDLSTLYQGMYIVQITDLNSGKAEVHKLIKK